MKPYLPLAIILVTSSAANAVTPQVGDVSDRRTTGQFFNDLEVEMKLQGEDVADIRYVKVNIEEAKDDTGKDLIKTDRSMTFTDKYTEISEFNSAKNLKINLKNPSRKAVTFDVKGTINTVIPAKDPTSIVSIKKISSSTGKAIENPVLKAAKIEFKILTDADLQKIKDEEKKKSEEAAKKQGVAPSMVSMFQQVFMGDGAIKPNQLRVSKSDPDSRLVSFKILKVDGKEVRSNGWSGQEEMRVYGFSEDIPQDATIELIVATDKAMEKIPFAFTSVYLP